MISSQVMMRMTICFAGILLGGLGLIAVEESLIDNSPFKQIETRSSRQLVSSVTTQGNLNQRFELSGVNGILGVLEFSVHDKTSKKSTWVKIGETIEGVEIESFDQTKMGLIVSQAGKREMLVIREGATNHSRGKPILSYNNISHPTMPSVDSYPKPPPPLPKPNRLIEQLRKQKK